MKNNILKRRIFCILLTLATISYLVWRLFFTMPYDHDAVSIAAAFVLLIAEVFGALELLIYFYLDTGSYVKKPQKTSQPNVDVFVTACGEPAELLEDTLKACLSMKYDGKFKVYLLDDRPSDEMKRRAEALGAIYMTREDHSNAKAGNLNAALKKTGAPYIAVFDADMCPREDFLLRTAPFMTKNMAFVQTPQSFKNPDLFQSVFGGKDKIYGEQDFFYQSIEPARNRSNAVVLAGSNMLISRKALEDVGGFDTDTLTEDFATGIKMQQKGYRASCIEDTLADGLAPESFGALIKQRQRWAAGCIQAGKKTRFILNKEMSIKQKLSYLISVSYWYFPIKRLIYFVAPLLFALGNISVMRCNPITAAIYWLPMFLLTNIGLIWFSGGTRTVGWSMFYETCLAPFLFIRVITASFGIGNKKFVVTDKSGKNDWKFVYLIPFIIGAGLNIWGLINVYMLSVEEGTWYYLVLIGWLIYHLYMQICALIFVLSCKKRRDYKEEKDIYPAKNWYMKIKIIQLLKGAFEK